MGAWRVWALRCTARREIKKGTHESPQYYSLSLSLALSPTRSLYRTAVFTYIVWWDRKHVWYMFGVFVFVEARSTAFEKYKLEMHSNSFECIYFLASRAAVQMT